MVALFGKGRTALRLNLSDLLLAAVCLAVAWLVRVGLWLLPFRCLLAAVTAARPLGRPSRRVQVSRIAWAVRLACRYVPGPTCLVRALAGRSVLSLHGHPSGIRIGVSLDVRQLEAHAWLESEGQVLIGGSDAHARYRPFAELSGRRA
jgi:hypothetical protein